MYIMHGSQEYLTELKILSVPKGVTYGSQKYSGYLEGDMNTPRTLRESNRLPGS